MTYQVLAGIGIKEADYTPYGGCEKFFVRNFSTAKNLSSSQKDQPRQAKRLPGCGACI